jgi:hypothetical protein
MMPEPFLAADPHVRDLADYLRSAKVHAEATLRTIGAAVRLAPSTLSAFFTGSRLPTAGNLRLIVTHLGGDVTRAEELRRAAVASLRGPRQDGPPPPAGGLALLHTGHNLSTWDRGPRPRLNGGFRTLADLAEDTLPIRERDLGDFSAAALREARLVILVTAKDRGYSAAEIDHIVQYVSAGGSLLVLAAYWWRSDHDTNVGDLTGPFGIHLNDDRVESTIALGHAFRPMCTSRPPIRVRRPVAVPFACSLSTRDGAAPVLVTDERATAAVATLVDRRIVRTSTPGAAGPLTVAGRRDLPGGGRVLVVGAWEAFLDEYVNDPELGNGDFVKGALQWLTTNERGGC